MCELYGEFPNLRNDTIHAYIMLEDLWENIYELGAMDRLLSGQ